MAVIKISNHMSSSSLSAGLTLPFLLPYFRKSQSWPRSSIFRSHIRLNSSITLLIVRCSRKFSCNLMERSGSARRQQLFACLKLRRTVSQTSFLVVSSSSSLECSGEGQEFDASCCNCQLEGVSMVFSRKSQQFESSTSLPCTLELILEIIQFFSSAFSASFSSFLQRCSFSRILSQAFSSFSSLDSSENRQLPYLLSVLVSALLTRNCSQGRSRFIFVLASSLRWIYFLKVFSAFDFYSGAVEGSFLRIGVWAVLRVSPLPREDSTLWRSWQKRSRLKLELRLSDRLTFIL